MSDQQGVAAHYARGAILSSIEAALEAMGKNVARLSPIDLAPVDEFHVRGREATIELSARAAIRAGSTVLDVGCGLGGSARYLASEHRCRVVGVDLTQEYVDTAATLARWVGLDEDCEFHWASALELPFDDGSFDVVWTEHVQMNVADKAAFYGELARVLVPGGRLLFHDIFEGEGLLHYPVPWAEEASISFLEAPGSVKQILEDGGFEIVDWEDTSRASLEWFTVALERPTLERSANAGPPPLGLHLLMGDTARVKLENITRNLREGRIVVVQAVANKKK